jgi:hypothetical protein
VPLASSIKEALLWDGAKEIMGAIDGTCTWRDDETDPFVDHAEDVDIMLYYYCYNMMYIKTRHFGLSRAQQGSSPIIDR